MSLFTFDDRDFVLLDTDQPLVEREARYEAVLKALIKNGWIKNAPQKELPSLKPKCNNTRKKREPTTKAK